MIRTYQHLSLIAMLLSGCSSSDPQPSPQPPVDTTAQENAQLCVEACDVAKTCYKELDLSACQEQCGEELAGTGNFSAEFASVYMKALADAKTDTSCTYSRDLTLWRDKIPETLKEPAVLQECVDAFADGCDVSTLDRGKCYEFYYIWNTEIREKVSQCFSIEKRVPPCLERRLCVTESRLPSAPWLAMPCRPNPFFGCQ